jgi:hypothetical protein
MNRKVRAGSIPASSTKIKNYIFISNEKSIIYRRFGYFGFLLKLNLNL